MVFINNKYTKWYYAIVTNASSRKILPQDYRETHHIIPKSLGGDNSKENTVKLTAREHFICHWLLIKMLTGPDKAKMVYAVWCLANQNNPHQKRNKISSRKYEILRKAFIKTKRGSKAPPSYNQKIMQYWTDEQRVIHAEKISRVTKGKKLAESTKEKLRNKTWSEKAIQNRLNNCLSSAAARKGVAWDDHRRKMGEETYFNKNLALAAKVFSLTPDYSINAIAKTLGVDWFTVKTIINRQTEFEKRLKTVNSIL